MAAARFAAVFLAVLPLAGAQQTPSTAITVNVKDVTGAPVPGAQVDIGNGCNAPVGGETGSQGSVSINPTPGPADPTVTSPGFCPAKKRVDVLNQPGQTVPIELQVGGCPSACTPVCVTVTPAAPDQAVNAQPERHAAGSLTVRVTDPSGAAVPAARIEVDPSGTTHGPALKTDGQGLAFLDPTAGMHTILITSSGFYRWSHRIDIPNGLSRTVEAMLRVGAQCGPVIVASVVPDIPLEMPDPGFLPLRPVVSLYPLPPRP